MRTIYDIAKAELQSLFYSPIAWLMIIIFTMQTGIRFAGTFDNIVWTNALELPLQSGLTEVLFPSVFTGVFPTILNQLYLYIPLLTMGLVSRELSSGSIKLLYSSPISNAQIILGKFLAMMLFGLLLVGIVAIYVFFSAVYIKDFDLLPTLTGLLGVYFLICIYSAVGIYMSSLTSYQVVAAISTLLVLGALNFVKGLWLHIEWVRDVTWWLGMSGRAQEFINGLICSEDVVYFIVVTALFLMFAIIRLQGKRAKVSKGVTWGKYIGTFLVVALIGYVSSRPKMMFFYDTTATKHNTLTEASQEIMKQLEGGLKITTYVNAVDPDFGYFFPKSRNQDIDRFRQYTRFKPEIEFDYVYYYDTYNGTTPESNDNGEGARKEMVTITQTYREDSTLFLRPGEIRKIVDLWPEKNHIVKVIERENGEKTFLRLFNDQMKFPFESEISIALKHLVMKMPLVGFTTGHGERSFSSVAERDYNAFSMNKPFRNALINQGYDFTNVDLTQGVPAEVDVLVIADVRKNLTEAENQALDEYIARGGNLLILGDLNRQESMNPIVDKFGVEFLTGQLVCLSDYTMPDLILARETSACGNLSDYFKHNIGLQISMPGCVGLSYTETGEYEVVPLFESVGEKVWNETKTTDFVNETLECDPEDGEEVQTFSTALALHRQVNGKEQKIIIMGDSDCFSTGELTTARKNVQGYNFSAIVNIFNWLGDNKAPLDVSRPPKHDDGIYLGEAGMKVAKSVFCWGLPLFFLIAGILLWIRRRSR